MHQARLSVQRLLGIGLLVGYAGCADHGSDDPGAQALPTATTRAALQRAGDCGDLLTKIHDDAIAKVKMAAELARTSPADSEFSDNGADGVATSGPVRSAGSSSNTSKDPLGVPSASLPSANGESAQDDDQGGGASVSGPTGASETNAQVKGVEEADFVKVVQSGAGIFVLQGNTLQKLKSFPAAETALSGTPLTLEGYPSELFVTDAGKAVVFSNVAGSVKNAGTKYPGSTDIGSGADFAPCASNGNCYQGGYYGGDTVKITVADVTTGTPLVERELYYEGSYVSARRYASAASDIVRVVVQSGSDYDGLYEPVLQRQDPWGRPYDDATIKSQLDEWVARTETSIRNTKLEDWLPTAYEVQNGKQVELPRQCDSYYVPIAGLASYGLTQVVTLDAKQPTQPVRDVTVVGSTSTVYSNGARLVLAQPDYQWSRFSGPDAANEQRTALHVFDLADANTTYTASGWVSGTLPQFNPQFGIDVSADGTVRVATTGQVRDTPSASPDTPEYWASHPETHVITAQVHGNQLDVVGKTPNLGEPGETIQSARFVGNRAYVVTYRQTDPLVVVDVTNAAAPLSLGQIKIPGFSQYMQPIDDNHLMTIGQGASWGIQLQMFDVTDPKNIPLPKTLDFGSGSSSEASYSHKAFTLYNGVLALPVSGSYSPLNSKGAGYYSSALQLVKVDLANGLTLLGSVDHAPLYADNGAGVRCGVCDAIGCSAYACGYSPEVRRGVFVSSASATYVYSFSYAGVLVNDLTDLTHPLAKVGLPQPIYTYDGSSGYGGGVRNGGTAVSISKPSSDSARVLDAGTPVSTSLLDAGVITVAPAQSDAGL